MKMALLETCFCCNLLVAAVLVGVYVMVAYAIAFTIELWWILETEVTLPAPAYLLCVGYFFVFIQSALLLHGLSVKRSFFLLGWVFLLVIFSFPEAGLVLFMSLYHWELDGLYGLTELTCWVCRLCINIAGMLIVQSLYSQWKEEEEVIQQIHALRMVSMAPQAVPILPNGNNALIAYHNEAFVKSTNHINGSLQRPVTPQLQPINNNVAQQLNNMATPHLATLPDFGCEFNAAQFDLSYKNQIVNNLNPTTMEKQMFQRSRSLMDVRSMYRTKDRFENSDSKSCIEPMRYTQSLDRRIMKFSKNLNSDSLNQLNDSNSLERMNVYRDWDGRYILQTEGERSRFSTMDGRARSKRSLAESDDFKKYSDFAL